MQLLCHEPANRCFAGAHEANERDIDDVAVALHAISFTVRGSAFKVQKFENFRVRQIFIPA
jgi:hypothetical protein